MHLSFLEVVLEVLDSSKRNKNELITKQNLLEPPSPHQIRECSLMYRKLCCRLIPQSKQMALELTWTEKMLWSSKTSYFRSKRAFLVFQECGVWSLRGKDALLAKRTLLKVTHHVEAKRYETQNVKNWTLPLKNRTDAVPESASRWTRRTVVQRADSSVFALVLTCNPWRTNRINVHEF